jgi:uncharacterized membrane protein YdjX (TVP38/TMEM64 family)
MVNFPAGLSSIRLVPYLVATAVGLLPGMITVVVLGDALAGRTDPALIVVPDWPACYAWARAGIA